MQKRGQEWLVKGSHLGFHICSRRGVKYTEERMQGGEQRAIEDKQLEIIIQEVIVRNHREDLYTHTPLKLSSISQYHSNELIS